MTTFKSRPVKVRLTGDPDAARLIADLIAADLPALADGRCWSCDMSAPYPNHRDHGFRIYLDLNVLRPEASS